MSTRKKKKLYHHWEADEKIAFKHSWRLGLAFELYKIPLIITGRRPQARKGFQACDSLSLNLPFWSKPTSFRSAVDFIFTFFHAAIVGRQLCTPPTQSLSSLTSWQNICSASHQLDLALDRSTFCFETNTSSQAVVFHNLTNYFQKFQNFMFFALQKKEQNEPDKLNQCSVR